MTYIFFNKLIVRTPIFSFNYLIRIFNSSNSDILLNELLTNKVFMHGVLISSPNLYYELNKVEIPNEKIRLTLLKYLIRSSTRCIPFGLFSGIGILDGKISLSEQSNIVLKEIKQHTRLDSKLSYKILNKIIDSDEIKTRLSYFPNSTLYKIADKYRYIDYKTSQNGFLKFNFSQVQKDSYLKKIIKLCSNGIEYQNLVEQIIDEGFSEEDSKHYINELISNKIITSSLEASTIGNTIEQNLLNRLKILHKSFDSDFKIKEHYDSINNYLSILKKIDSKSIENSLLETKAFITHLKEEVSKKIEVAPLHKEIYFKVNGELTSNQFSLIKESIDVLNIILTNQDTEKTRFEAFKDAFYEKYESFSIPLAIALDIETGIGYGQTLNSSGLDDNLLIKGFPRNIQKNKNSYLKTTTNKIDSFFIRKIEKFNSKRIIALTETDFLSLKKIEKENTFVKNPTGVVRFSLYKNLVSEDVIYIKSIAQTSPNKILGRFTLGNNDIAELAQEIANYENDFYGQNVIIAEIDHLPDPTPGNILIRSRFRKFQINYIGGNNETEGNIPISDLFLLWKNDELILISKKHKKKVIPYFSNSFDINSPNNLPIFKFLLDLSIEYESKRNWNFNIKKFHNYFLHIPRITYKNIILSKESWYVSKKNFIETESDIQFDIKNFNINCCRLGLPEYFYIVNEDRELLISRNNLDTAKIFLIELKKSKNLHLQEFLMSEFDSILTKDRRGFKVKHNNEFFLPFKNNHSYSKKVIENKTTANNLRKVSVQRVFIPGSEWIYFKIYIGSKIVNDLLICLEKLLLSLNDKKMIKSFFFINFRDPNHHIRLRILVKDLIFFNTIINQIYLILEKFRKNEFITDIKIDTYKRELDRYGWDDIVHFENIFYEDSKLVLKVIKHLMKTNGFEKRWMVCIVILDTYCNLFDFSFLEKLDFSTNCVNYFIKEFNADNNTNKFINKKYDHFKDDILYLIQNYENLDLGIDINKFKEGVLNSLQKLQKYEKDKMDNFLMSLVHMHIIRLVGAHDNRLYEFLIYSFYLKSLKTLSYINKDFS